MSQVSSPASPSVEESIDDSAQLAWELFSHLVDSLELAITLGDADRAQQIWTPLTAVNSDLMSFYGRIVTDLANQR